jgi:hypothetical protein
MPSEDLLMNQPAEGAADAGATVRGTRGLVSSIALSGYIRPEFSQCWAEMRSWNDRNGLLQVEYRHDNGVLIESARDAVCMHALKEKYDWVLQIDADAAPFAPDSCARMVQTLFVTHSFLSALGAWAQVKGFPHHPTIDTGSGTWEEHYPGEGIIPVIRTGAHFLMVKVDAFKRMGPPPWFRTRIAPNPLQAMKEVDNWARQRHRGRNPLWTKQWELLMEEAYLSGPPRGVGPVGEDSAFCDNLRSFGMMMAVDTDMVVGHVATKTIMPSDFIEAYGRQLREQRLALGVRG